MQYSATTRFEKLLNRGGDNIFLTERIHDQNFICTYNFLLNFALFVQFGNLNLKAAKANYGVFFLISK